MADLNQLVQDSLRERVAAFRAFAEAHEGWEAAALSDDGPWIDQMPDELQDQFQEVQRLRNIALEMVRNDDKLLTSKRQPETDS